ncbi:hypothetical protein BDZ91DRAFT_761741 [Kalaharituber pfeilii]|nr:hypothetical protein BDZ91DRAFT_761741 [Kalaharituber pfeilii]
MSACEDMLFLDTFEGVRECPELGLSVTECAKGSCGSVVSGVVGVGGPWYCKEVADPFLAEAGLVGEAAGVGPWSMAIELSILYKAAGVGRRLEGRMLLLGTGEHFSRQHREGQAGAPSRGAMREHSTQHQTRAGQAETEGRGSRGPGWVQVPVPGCRFGAVRSRHEGARLFWDSLVPPIGQPTGHAVAVTFRWRDDARQASSCRTLDARPAPLLCPLAFLLEDYDDSAFLQSNEQTLSSIAVVVPNFSLSHVILMVGQLSADTAVAGAPYGTTSTNVVGARSSPVVRQKFKGADLRAEADARTVATDSAGFLKVEYSEYPATRDGVTTDEENPTNSPRSDPG